MASYYDERSAPPGNDAETYRPPVLEGRHVLLKPLSPEDYPFVRMIETSAELGARWRLRGSTPSPAEWERMTWSAVLAQFLVLTQQGNEAIGVVTAYEANFQDGYAYLAAAKFDPESRSPLMLLGLGLFVEYVFTCWNFRKLYIDVPEYNLTQFASGEGKYFTIEGRLREHTYYGGRLWDRVVLAIYRDGWAEQARRLLAVEVPA